MNEKEEKFDFNKYNQKYKKDNYKQFKVDLKKTDYEKICSLLLEKGLTKVQFVKDAYEELKKK